MNANDRYRQVWTDGQMIVEVYRRGKRVWVSVYDGGFNSVEIDCHEADRVADAIHDAAAVAREMEVGDGDAGLGGVK